MTPRQHEVLLGLVANAMREVASVSPNMHWDVPSVFVLEDALREALLPWRAYVYERFRVRPAQWMPNVLKGVEEYLLRTAATEARRADIARRLPQRLRVLDDHGGFTIESRPPHWFKGKRFDFAARRRQGNDDRLNLGDTLWRPGRLLKGTTEGVLVDFDERSFYQDNNDVTRAVYRVPGYGWPVVVWFDNATGRRIA